MDSFISNYSNHYRNVNSSFTLAKYRRAVLKEHGDLLGDKSKKVLDIGCGPGYLLKVLEGEGFRNLTGVDIDLNQTLDAKKSLEFSKVFNQGVAEFLEENNEKYDLIFLYDLIEHIRKENTIPLLKLVHKSLESGGFTFVKTFDSHPLLV